MLLPPPSVVSPTPSPSTLPPLPPAVTPSPEIGVPLPRLILQSRNPLLQQRQFDGLFTVSFDTYTCPSDSCSDCLRLNYAYQCTSFITSCLPDMMTKADYYGAFSSCLCNYGDGYLDCFYDRVATGSCISLYSVDYYRTLELSMYMSLCGSAPNGLTTKVPTRSFQPTANSGGTPNQNYGAGNNANIEDTDKDDKGGLSAAAKVDIGVGVGMGALLIAGLIFAVWWYRRKAKASKAVTAADTTSGKPNGSQAMQQQPVVGETKNPELAGYYVPQQPPSSTPSPYPYNATSTPVSQTSTAQPVSPGATVALYSSVSPPPQSVVEADSREIASQPQNQHQYQPYQQPYSPPAHAQLNTQYYQQAGQSPQPPQQAQQLVYPQHPNIPELSGN